MNAADHVLDPARIALAPNAIALIADGRSVSYAALLDLTNRIGNALLSLGIAPEQRVALMMNDSTELVAAYLAAIKIGAVAVALFTFRTFLGAADSSGTTEATTATAEPDSAATLARTASRSTW